MSNQRTVSRGKPIKKNTPNIQAKEKVFISISFPGFCATIILSIIALFLSFMFGVMIGRGDSVEHKVSEYVPFIKSSNELIDVPTQELRPEDLNFMSELKQKTKRESDEDLVEVTPEKMIDGTIQSKSLDSTVNPRNTDNISETSLKGQSESIMYNCVFKVASFEKESQAKELSVKLEEKGLQSQIDRVENPKGDASYVIRVLFGGSEDKIDTVLKPIFEQLRLKDIMCITKAPVTAKHTGH